MPVGQWRFLSQQVYLAVSLEWFVLLSAGILKPRTMHLRLSVSGLDTKWDDASWLAEGAPSSSAKHTAAAPSAPTGETAGVATERRILLSDASLSCCKSTCKCHPSTPLPPLLAIDTDNLADPDATLNADVAELLFDSLNFSSPLNTLLWKPHKSTPYIYQFKDAKVSSRKIHWLDQGPFVVGVIINFVTGTVMSLWALAFFQYYILPEAIKQERSRDMHSAASWSLKHGKNQNEKLDTWKLAVMSVRSPRLGFVVRWNSRAFVKDITKYHVEVKCLSDASRSFSYYVDRGQVIQANQEAGLVGLKEIFISAQHPSDTTLAKILFWLTHSRAREPLEPFHQPLLMKKRYRVRMSRLTSNFVRVETSDWSDVLSLVEPTAVLDIPFQLCGMARRPNVEATQAFFKEHMRPIVPITIPVKVSPLCLKPVKPINENKQHQGCKFQLEMFWGTDPEVAKEKTHQALFRHGHGAEFVLREFKVKPDQEERITREQLRAHVESLDPTETATLKDILVQDGKLKPDLFPNAFSISKSEFLSLSPSDPSWTSFMRRTVTGPPDTNSVKSQLESMWPRIPKLHPSSHVFDPDELEIARSSTVQDTISFDLLQLNTDIQEYELLASGQISYSALCQDTNNPIKSVVLTGVKKAATWGHLELTLNRPAQSSGWIDPLSLEKQCKIICNDVPGTIIYEGAPVVVQWRSTDMWDEQDRSKLKVTEATQTTENEVTVTQEVRRVTISLFTRERFQHYGQSFFHNVFYSEQHINVALGAATWYVADIQKQPTRHSHVFFVMSAESLGLAVGDSFQGSKEKLLDASNVFLLKQAPLITDVELAYAAFAKQHRLEMDPLDEGDLASLGVEVEEMSLKVLQDVREPLPFEDATRFYSPGQSCISQHTETVNYTSGKQYIIDAQVKKRKVVTNFFLSDSKSSWFSGPGEFLYEKQVQYSPELLAAVRPGMSETLEGPGAVVL